MILSPPLILGVYVGVGTSGGGHQDFSISTIFTSLVIIALLSTPLVHLFQVLPSLGAAHGCFGRLNTFLQLEEKTDFREFGDGNSAPFTERTAARNPEAPIVSLRDVSLGWNAGNAPVLTNINLEVKRGAKIAIVGPVGAGKTLLLKGIIGEVYKTHGRVSLSPTTSLAYCSQKPWLENMSAKRNLTQYGNESYGSEFYRQLASDCMLDDVVQLPTFASGAIGTGGVMLSGGQRQRLALARALSTKSGLLIIDDGFSALDRKTRRHVSEMLLNRTLNPANTDRTVIYSTHDGTSAVFFESACLFSDC